MVGKQVINPCIDLASLVNFRRGKGLNNHLSPILDANWLDWFGNSKLDGFFKVSRLKFHRA
jgi:hypothetical protein